MRRAKDELLLNPAAYHRKYFQRTYLSPNYKRQIFDTHDIEHALLPGPAFDLKREFNTAGYVFHSLELNGECGVYAAGGISKDMLANILAVKEGPFTVILDDGTVLQACHVSDMEETVGSQLFNDKVLEQNKRIQMQKQSLLRTLFPGEHILVPIMLQGMVSLVGQAEFDRGTKRRDPDWMQLWTPDIRENIHIIPVVGSWFFSGATSGYEYPEAECIAAGLRDVRPQADMWFRDWDNKDVPQSEIIRRRVEYLMWAAEKGNFRVKLEATAFMRSCAIAEMANRGQLPRANPVFLKGISDNFTDIDYMRKEMEPLILDRIRERMFPMDTTDLESIFPDFVKKVEEAKAGHRPGMWITSIPACAPLEGTKKKMMAGHIYIHCYADSELDAGDFEQRELGARDRAKYLDETEKTVVTRPMRPVDMKGTSYIEHDGRSLFCPPLLDRLNERERHQVSAMIGGMETVMQHDGRSVYIVADDGLQGERKSVRNARRKQLREHPIMQRFMERNQPVRFSYEIEDAITGFDALPNFSNALGQRKPGEHAAQMIRHLLLARNITDFCYFRGQWEHLDSGVQTIMLATRMQLGLEAASPVDPQFVRVFDERGHYLTLADRARAIFEPLKKALLETPDAPHLREQASAVVQLRAYHRLQRDHTFRHHVFRDLRESQPKIHLPEDMAWERIPPHLFYYNHYGFDHYWHNTVMPALEQNASQIIRLHNLDQIEDFRSIRDAQLAAQNISARRHAPNASIYHRLTLCA